MVETRTGSIKRIKGLAASPPSRDFVEPAAATEGAAEPLLHSLVKGSGRTDLRAFRRAGWHFVVGADAVSGGELRRVYRDRGGRLLIEGRRLTVRFAAEVSEARIKEVLGNHGLSVKRRLGFAPNLFEVACAEDAEPFDDIVELARGVAGHREVVYAEPALIEALQGRGERSR